MTPEESKRIIEALLFASDQPLSIDQLKEVISETDGKTIRSQVEELKAEYEKENHSFRITEVAGGFQFSTDPTYSSWIKKLYKSRHVDRLSSPSLETLSIITYRQPVTRADIELIRGVNVEGVLKTLLERGLIRIVGRKDVVGRPFVYGTTKEFLEYFGLNSLDDLPKLEEFTEEGAKDALKEKEPI